MKISRSMGLLLAGMVGTLAVVGCEQKPAAKPAVPAAGGTTDAAKGMMDKAKDGADKAATAVGDAWKKGRDEAVKVGESSLAALKGQLDIAATQVAKLPEMVKGAAESSMKVAKDSYAAAEAKLAELRGSDERGWSGISDGFNSAMTKLTDSLKSVTDKMPK